MRSHEDIVKAVGASKLAARLPEVGVQVGASTPQRWADRNSIPSQYWAALVSLEAATLPELAAGAGQRRRAQPQSGAAA